MNSATRFIVGIVLVGLLAVAATPVASAKRGDVLTVGSCTESATSKIKLSEENGRIEVEFEVDQNRTGVSWSVAIRHRGQVVRRLVRVTRGPSGSFEARVVVPNGPGADRIAATAIRRGETCTAAAGF
ncbi:MAG: hypothetical protein H0U46_09065 [Actinobacteria bacterium]|nr:hypothetical protein [Actinomycetota bacterium]